MGGDLFRKPKPMGGIYFDNQTRAGNVSRLTDNLMKLTIQVLSESFLKRTQKQILRGCNFARLIAFHTRFARALRLGYTSPPKRYFAVGDMPLSLSL